MEAVTERITGRGRLAVAALALLLYASFFKAAPAFSGIPVDLTVAGDALTGLALVAVLLAGPNRVLSRPVVPLILLMGTFALGVGRIVPGDTYGPSKANRLFLITCVAMLGAVVLLDTQARQRAWVKVQIGLGAALAVAGYLVPAPVTDVVDYGRLTLAGSNTIAAGRAAGVAVVGCLVLALVGRRRLLLAVLGCLLVYPMISSGSRGPVAAAVLAVLLVALLAPASNARRTGRLVLAAAVVAGGYYYLRSDTSGGAGRVTSTLFAGNLSDTSSQARALMWHDAWEYILGHPFGGGWGSMSVPRYGFDLLGTQGLNYPHDVWLEVTAEAGWVAGLATLAFLFFGLRRLRRAASDPYRAALFGIALFFTLNALVSGDVNDNRLMWASVALGFVALRPEQARSSDWRRATPVRHIPAGIDAGVPAESRSPRLRDDGLSPAWARAFGID